MVLWYFWILPENEISVVEVGVLPDMITYSPDGSFVMTANEGQPSDDYTEDPEGSASIITSNGGDYSAPTVTNVTFEAFNDQVVSLRNAGVRIFGPGASVAQDLEPEYIAISSDGATAYVSCQENNAFVVIDIESATAVDIYPLGTKDHSVGQPKLTEFVLNEILGDNWPSLGTPLFDNPAVQLGGFSGMHFAEGESSETEYVFYVVPDRGPNDGAVNRNSSTPAAPANLRPFKLPDYQGRIIRFTVDITDGSVELDDPILLQQEDGTPISGKGNIPGFDEVPVTVADGKFAIEPFTTEENLGSFSEFSVMSDASWETNLVDGNFVAEANGFGADTFSNDWLISPAYDLSGLTSASLSFKSYIRFDGGALDVLISTDYDGMGNPEDFSWDTITDQVTLADTDSLIESGDFDLANYLTSSTYTSLSSIHQLVLGLAMVLDGASMILL